MALTQRLEFRQSQALVMTPQLMQAIKLLQLSNLDLAAYVEGELERNPLLERTGDAEAERPNEPAAPDGATTAWNEGASETGGEREDDRAGPDDRPADDETAAAARAGTEVPVGYSEWSATGSGGREDGDYNLEAFVSVQATLTDHF